MASSSHARHSSPTYNKILKRAGLSGPQCVSRARVGSTLSRTFEPSATRHPVLHAKQDANSYMDKQMSTLDECIASCELLAMLPASKLAPAVSTPARKLRTDTRTAPTCTHRCTYNCHLNLWMLGLARLVCRCPCAMSEPLATRHTSFRPEPMSHRL